LGVILAWLTISVLCISGIVFESKNFYSRREQDVFYLKGDSSR